MASDWPDYFGYLRGVVLPVEIIDLPDYPSKQVTGSPVLSAGGSSTIVDTGSPKRGWLNYMFMRADGASTDAMKSKFKVTINGKTLEFTIHHIISLLSGATLPINAGDLGGVVRDDAAYNYSAWWRPRSRFTESLKIEIVNGDSANATQIVYLVWYEVK